MDTLQTRLARSAPRTSGTRIATALCSGWIVLALVGLGAPVPVRTAAIFLFVAYGPALALWRVIPARDGFERLAYGIGVSLSVSALIALLLGLVHDLSSLVGVTCLASFTTVAALVELATLRRAARQGERAQLVG